VSAAVIEDFSMHCAGGEFEFANPDLTELRVEDIATQLSRMYRWRGCVPVSVAMHSVAMSECANTIALSKWALMHDVAEIFIADVPSPVKHVPGMKFYRDTEKRLLRAVAKRFDLDWPIPEELHHLDKRALRSEVDAFFPQAHAEVHGIRPLPFEFAPAWTPARSKREFIAKAQALGIS
jgi:hypothetical protein